MLSRSNILQSFSILFISFLTTAALVYFLTIYLLNALVEVTAKFLFGTMIAGITVINQLVSLVN